MKREILESELKKLYPNRDTFIILNEIDRMIRNNNWYDYRTDNCFMLYENSFRSHCGNVIIVDTLISTKKGEGSKAIKYLKKEYPWCTIQLDCKLDNEAIEFYKKQGFEKRAWSLVR